MNSAKIVVHGVERNRMFQVLQLLAECVGAPTNSARPVGRGAVQLTLDSTGRVLFTADAHRDDGKRFIVTADEN